MPKVSIIIPIYGVEKYISRCVRSLFSQTIDDIEFIFIDDCTPDNSIVLLEQEIESKHPLIIDKNWIVRIERMPSNVGIAAVRKYGLQMASGDYIIHCDSDDWVEPDMIELMYKKAILENSDYVVSDYFTTDGLSLFKTISGCSTTNKVTLLSKILAMDNPWAIWNKLVRRSCYDGIVFPVGITGEDMCLSTQLLINANTVSYVQKALYNYCYNPNSITNTRSVEHETRKYRHFCNNVDIVISAINNHGLSEVYADSIVALKWKARKNIWRLCYDDNYYRIWKETYPEITHKLICNPYISRSDKLKYVLTILRVYPRKKDWIQ